MHSSSSTVLCTILLLIFIAALSVSDEVAAQTTTTSAIPTTSTTTNSSSSPTTSTAPPSTTASSSSSSSNLNNNSIPYGDDIELQLNTSLDPLANKCMSLNSDLKHPDLRLRGATIRAPICIPTTLNKTKGWKLDNGTASVNNIPSNDEIDNCVATCSMSTRGKQRSTAVTVIYSFGHCYCWDQDFHDEGTADKEAKEICCTDGRVYEDYLLLNSKCAEQMYANVFVTSILCPINGSLCSSTLAKDHCETTTTNTEGVEDSFECCVPEGSLAATPTWGLQVAQYTIIIISVLALFQVLYWIFRKKREDREEEEDERRREEQPRLLIVPTVMTNASAGDSSPASPTETQTITQVGAADTHAIQAAKEIVALYKLLDAVEVAELEGTGSEDCSVCIDPLKNSQSVKTPCQHMFHKNCLFQYIAHKLRDKVRQVTCPVCRAVLVDASVNEESSASSPSPGGQTQSRQSTSPAAGQLSPAPRRRQGGSSAAAADNNPLQRSLLDSNSNGNDVEMRSSRRQQQGNHSSGRRGSGQQPYTPRGASALL